MVPKDCLVLIRAYKRELTCRITHMKIMPPAGTLKKKPINFLATVHAVVRELRFRKVEIWAPAFSIHTPTQREALVVIIVQGLTQRKSDTGPHPFSHCPLMSHAK